MLEVSLIIPVYNGGPFISGNVSTVLAFMRRHSRSFEVVVVDDGSSDDTGDVLERSSAPELRVIRLPVNQGKYGAVKAGMTAACGRSRIFIDADLPFDLEAVPYMSRLINERGFHLVIGDRSLAESQDGARPPLLRRIATRAFCIAIRLLVTGGLFDTQCGLKGMRGDVADALFPLLRDTGFSGDVELLYVALKYNLEIKRIPVRLRRSEVSTVNVFKHSLVMLARIMTLPARWHKGVYYSDALGRLASQNYWSQPQG